MPLPLTVSCFSKIQIGSTFLVPAHLSSPGKKAVKLVSVCLSFIIIFDRSLCALMYPHGRSAGLMPTEARGNYLPELPYLRETKDLCPTSTQPCIPPGSLNRVPASAGVRAGMSPLPGGR